MDCVLSKRHNHLMHRTIPLQSETDYQYIYTKILKIMVKGTFRNKCVMKDRSRLAELLGEDGYHLCLVCTRESIFLVPGSL